jgi:hypothetical protein
MVEHADAIGNAHDDAHGVLDKQNGHGAFIAHAAHEGHHLQTFAGIHSGHRFVEHEKAGTGGKGAGDFEPALLAIGQVAGHDIAAAAQPDEI